VRSGIGPNAWKARYQKPEKQGTTDGWKGLGAVPWRETFDQAQADLNAYAKKKRWAETPWPAIQGIQKPEKKKRCV